MKLEINQEVCLEELLAIWPKFTNDLDKPRDRLAFMTKVKTAEGWAALKGHVECLIEDVTSKKLPNLSEVIYGLFKTSKKPPQEVSINPVVEKGELYQTTQDPEVLNVFNKVWAVWPRTPNITERRKLALAAFLDRVKAFPLADLETSCLAYANAFGDGSLVYPKLLRNYLNDSELVEEWLERSTVSNENEITRKQFEVAYKWYPSFTNKNTDKVKEASWVMYWRCVKDFEKLDFLALVQLYRRLRKADFNSSDQPEEDLITYTKSFVSFVGEFRQLFTGGRVWEAKTSMFAPRVVVYASENGVDINNVWSHDAESYFVRVLAYYCSTCPNIKEAIRQGLMKTVSVVGEAKEDPKKYNDIRDLDKAIREAEWLSKNIDSFTDLLYNKVCEVKLFELPVEVKND